MNIHVIDNLRAYMNEIENSVAVSGLNLKIETDFFAYRKYRNAQTERFELSALFDISRTYIAPNSAFWINCQNESGKTVHSQAFRFYDIGDHTINDHINAARLVYVPPHMQGLDDFEIALPGGTGNIGGSIAYHGELWMDKSLRASEFNMVFGRYGIAAARLLWGIDHCFAFMTSSNVFRGFHARVGYTNMEAAVWMKDNEAISRNWLVWMDRCNIDDMIKIPPAELKPRESKLVAA